MKADRPMEMIVQAVALALKDVYPGIKVYSESVKQGLPSECFVVFCIPGLNRKVSRNRYTMQGNTDISYIVRDDSDEAKLKELFAEKFQTVSTSLGTVEYNGSKVRFTDFNYQEADNVLHILASFNIQYFVTEDDTSEDVQD